MPETTVHLVLRTFLFQLLRFALGDSCCVGSDQFIYWRASDPRTCLAPDAFVKLGVKNAHFDSWKTWEGGAPELGVELGSESERTTWEEKLARYQDRGVHELVRFDSEAAGRRIRIWDRVDDDLVERSLDQESAESFVLERFWVVGDVEGIAGLRLSEDAAGERLLPSPLEAETARAQEAERRVRELEAELKRRG